MQQLSDDFFAAAGFSCNEHIDIRISDISDRAAQIFNCRRLTDQRHVVLCFIRQMAQAAIFQNKLSALARTQYTMNQSVGCKRLGDKVVSTILNGPDGHWNITMTSNQDNRQIGVDFADSGKKLQSVDLRHTHICNDHAFE